jgi:hypothetical protein
MNRLTALTAGVALAFSTGCKSDGEWSVNKALGWDDPPNRVVTPSTKNLPRANDAIAERVELLGQKLVAQNTFLGIQPLFFTVGIKEPLLFHTGTEQLYISEGLVERCKSDAELAAVLCAELGQMVAEKRTAKALGHDVEPIRDATHGTGAIPGGAAYDAGQQANLAYHERQHPRGGGKPDPVDAAKTARELLTAAGYSPAELDRVEPLLTQVKQSERGEKLKKQMSGSAPAPEWKK